LLYGEDAVAALLKKNSKITQKARIIIVKNRLFIG
jgi:hypothetical protein